MAWKEDFSKCKTYEVRQTLNDDQTHFKDDGGTLLTQQTDTRVDVSYKDKKQSPV